MAARLEALAEFYKRHGWEEAAKVLQADAQIFRKAGMPDRFSDLNNMETFQEIPPQQIYAYKRKLVEAFATLPPLPERHIGRGKKSRRATNILCTEQNALHINQHVGSSLPDDMRLEDLYIHRSTVTYAADPVAGTPEQTYHINSQRIDRFRELIGTLVYAGYEIISDIRATSLAELNRPKYHHDAKQDWEETLYDPDYLNRSHLTWSEASFIRLTIAQPNQLIQTRFLGQNGTTPEPTTNG